MARSELGRILETLLEDAVKGAKDAAEKKGDFIADTVRRGRGAVEDAKAVDKKVGEQITDAAKKPGDIPAGTTDPATGWPPSGPVGPKPGKDAPGGDQWRYQRYLKQQYNKGKGADDVLDFDTWKDRHFDKLRPGRHGGPAQVAAKDYLASEHGVERVENVRLGPQFVDGVRDNTEGGKDYFEVGKATQGGLPVSRERIKLANEVPALNPEDNLHFVDESNPDQSQWWTYHNGDDPMTKKRD